MSQPPATALGWGLRLCAGAAVLIGLQQLGSGQAPWPERAAAVAPIGADLAPAPHPAPRAPGEQAPPKLNPRPAGANQSAPVSALPTPDLPTGTAPPPYRILGTVASAHGQAVVLFGQGRVITVAAPMPLDPEYAVEAVLDDHLLLRHVPSSRGMVLRQTAAPPQHGLPSDPEDWPRD